MDTNTLQDETTYGVFFGDNTFPSATFGDYETAESYLMEMGVVARIRVRTDTRRPGIVAPVRVTYGEWQRPA